MGAPASVLPRLLALALTLPTLGGCSERRAAGQDLADPTLTLGGSAVGRDELGRQVLAALTSGDVAALERLRLTEQEHNEIVWPELPASAPEVNFPVDFAWSNIEARNRSALARTLPIYEGEELLFQTTECRGETRRFESFAVLTDCWVVFWRAGTPRLYEARLFKDVLARGMGHKVFRYYDGEPRQYEPSETPR